jgi:glucose/arabinose dehydrogenase
MRFFLALSAVLAASGLAHADDPTFPTSAGKVAVQTVANGLVHPWSLAFLPDGRMLVTERPGRMRVVARDGQLSRPLGNVPRVFAAGQGGLLDVALDRNYAQNQTIYFCYAEPEGPPNMSSRVREKFDSDGYLSKVVSVLTNYHGRTALARAKLNLSTSALDDLQVIFRQEGPLSSGNHFGCRIVQMPDNTLFLTMGEHFTDRDLAQTFNNDLGKIVHITTDGAPAPGNPFANKSGARPEIWSYGHRNPQGLAINPADGKLWEQEHGPMGGDEINLIVPGHNYGWPLVCYGVNYDGTPVGTGKATMEGVDDPLWHWTPSIAPSGMAFYTGDLFPTWKGSLFNGALKFQMLIRLEIKGDKVLKEERLLQGLHERIRDVRQGPDGALYLLTDNFAGRILRVTPAR